MNHPGAWEEHTYRGLRTRVIRHERAGPVLWEEAPTGKHASEFEVWDKDAGAWGDEKTPCTRTNRVHSYWCESCGQRHLQWDECRKLDCARCCRKGGAVAKKRGARVLKNLGGVPWGIYVVTLPNEWQSRLTYDSIRLFGQRVREIVAAHCQTLVRERFGAPKLDVRIGMRAYWHPEGDQKPGVARWHYNLIVPLVAVVDPKGEGWTDRRGRRHHRLGVPAFQTPAQLEALRAQVAGLLADMAQALGEARPTPNAFYEYRAGGGKQRHAAEYFGRPFAHWKDALDVLGQSRDYGVLGIGARRGLGELWGEYRQWVKRPADDFEAGLVCLRCGGNLLHYGLLAWDNAEMPRILAQGALWILAQAP